MKSEKELQIKEAVREHYAELITKTGDKGLNPCCKSLESDGMNEKSGGSCCGPVSSKEISSQAGYAETIGYDTAELSELPEGAVNNTFGCGAPLSQAEIREGDVVLDLGSGAGLDVLLASRQVGNTGKAIGVDMTPEMIEKAKENALKMGADNVEFRLGELENMPIESNSVDWVISNCVINLSPDKLQVFKEAYRVLKPGGKMIVSDIVADGLSEELRKDLSAWAGCVAGALSENEYLQAINDAGFAETEVLSRALVEEEVLSQVADKFSGKIASIKVKAVKS